MPRNYGAPFIRLTAYGTLYGVEKWAFTLSLAGDTSAPTVAQATAARDAIAPLMGSTFITSNLTFNGVKLARIGEDGLYGAYDSVVSEYPVNAPARGTATAGHLPPQIALAVTLLGASPRQAAGRGRFYLPGPARGLAADGRLGQQDATTFADNCATMINAVNAALPGGVMIVGPATATGRAPARQAVEAVRVGRVYDTIRSRRSSMPEEPVLATVALTNDDAYGANVTGASGTF